jgi:transposase
MSDYKRKKPKSDKPLTREEELKRTERLRCENALLKKLDIIQARRNPKS